MFIKPAVSQTETERNNSFLAFVKELYTTSDLLVNGKELLPGDPRINKHPYLFAENWIGADVYIKGEVFNNQNVRYNLYTDQIILQFIKPEGVSGVVLLDNEMVDSVDINGHLLISAMHLGHADIDRSFVEVIEAEQLKYCIAYFKDYIRMYSTMNPYGKYSDTKNKKYVLKDAHLHKADKRRHFLNIFPEHKKKIRRFLRNNNIKYKNATASQIKTLMQFCNGLD